MIKNYNTVTTVWQRMSKTVQKLWCSNICMAKNYYFENYNGVTIVQRTTTLFKNYNAVTTVQQRIFDYVVLKCYNSYKTCFYCYKKLNVTNLRVKSY